mgnify:CR=1 FL=1
MYGDLIRRSTGHTGPVSQVARSRDSPVAAPLMPGKGIEKSFTSLGRGDLATNDGETANLSPSRGRSESWALFASEPKPQTEFGVGYADPLRRLLRVIEHLDEFQVLCAQRPFRYGYLP